MNGGYGRPCELTASFLFMRKYLTRPRLCEYNGVFFPGLSHVEAIPFHNWLAQGSALSPQSYLSPISKRGMALIIHSSVSDLPTCVVAEN